MAATDYLVEMTFIPFGSLLSPQEVLTFSERFVLPTLEACQKLRDSGRIVAGGTALAAVGFTFIARTDSPQELEDMVAGLPLWARAQTRVVPLGTFESRLSAIRERLNQLKPHAPKPAAVSQNN
jgi:hypothetical protein